MSTSTENIMASQRASMVSSMVHFQCVYDFGSNAGIGMRVVTFQVMCMTVMVDPGR
jgi:hypothetical protein